MQPSVRHPPDAPVPLILKVIIDRRPLALTHTLLLPIHLGNLSAVGRLIRLLIVSQLDEAGKSQADTFLRSRIQTLLTTRFVSRTQRQICRLDLPHISRLKPDIWLVLIGRRMGIEGFGAVDDDVFELGEELFENRFREAGTDVTNSLVGFRGRVIAGEEEGSVDRGTFALAKVGAQNDKIQRVSYSGEVIFLDLVSSASSMYGRR